MVRVVVEVSGWEHECCGPAYELDTVVELACRPMSGAGDDEARYLETHHEVDAQRETTRVSGRIAEIRLAHPDGSTEQIIRVPSGKAIRGFDDHDDGHLERPWTGEPVVSDSVVFLLTIAGAEVAGQP